MTRLPFAHSGAVAAVVALALASCRPAGARQTRASTHDSNDAAPPGVLVGIVGRFDRRDPAGPRFSWPASRIEAEFTGTGIDVRLREEGTSYFAAVVDGQTPSVLVASPGTRSYTIASGLAAGRHTVALVKRTEAKVGVAQFLGFAPHEGALVEHPASTARRIEFIGDSITCGYGDLGDDPAEHFLPALEDETVAYGALTASALGAEHTAIAYSGIGVYRNNHGSEREQMPVLFRRTLPDDPTSVWGFEPPPPDVVVINLGTNDFARGDPGAAFERAYAAFVRSVRAAYPAAVIVCALSPLLTDAYPPDAMNRTHADREIRAAVDELTAGGDRRVRYFVFAEQQLADGFGSDYHPSAQSHRRMAEQLAPFLRSLMHW